METTQPQVAASPPKSTSATNEQPASGAQPAANACTCEKCAGACSHKPGWFKPDEIAPLASALGLTEQQLFDQHLQVDWWEGDEDSGGEDVFILSPAVVGGTPGDMFDRDPTGRCVWFKRGRCAIHDIGKPFECAAYHHTDEDQPGHHRQAMLAWNKPKHQKQIAKLLGREPETAGGWGIFDQFGLGGMFA